MVEKPNFNHLFDKVNEYIDIKKYDGIILIPINPTGQILLGLHGPGNQEYFRLPGSWSLLTETKDGDPDFETFLLRTIQEEMGIDKVEFNNFFRIEGLFSFQASPSRNGNRWLGLCVLLFFIGNPEHKFNSQDGEIIDFEWRNPSDYMSNTETDSRRLIKSLISDSTGISAQLDFC